MCFATFLPFRSLLCFSMLLFLIFDVLVFNLNSSYRQNEHCIKFLLEIKCNVVNVDKTKCLSVKAKSFDSGGWFHFAGQSVI